MSINAVLAMSIFIENYVYISVLLLQVSMSVLFRTYDNKTLDC